MANDSRMRERLDKPGTLFPESLKREVTSSGKAA